jgi:copper transport protein
VRIASDRGSGGFLAVLRRAAALAAVAGAVFLLIPAVASAHAYLITTSPAIGAVVPSSPSRVSLTYDEPITFSPGALGVYDAAGRRVDSGTVTHPLSDTIAVSIPRRLGHGTYTVAWRVTSADTHVVHGVFTFSVGAPGATGGIGARLFASGQIPEGISVGFAVVRFLNLLLLLACAGGGVALLLVLRDADAGIRRRLLGALVVSGGLLAIVAVLGLPFEAAEVGGTNLADGFRAGLLAAVRGQRFGETWLLRAWLAVLFAVIALSLQVSQRRWRTAREIALLGVGVALPLTATAAGHASVGGTLAFVADGAHVLGAAAWLGGLAFVLAALALSPPQARWPLAIRSVPRFSLLAAAAVAVLVVAGIVSAYREVGAWRGLWETTYGELILTKAALALPLLALGAYNNRVTVPALRSGGAASPTARTRLLRAAGAELALLVVIVAVTAVLIDEPPAKNEVQQTATITVTRAVGPFTATIAVRPGVVGSNMLNMSVTATRGRPLTIGEVDVAADPPTRGTAPLNLNVVALSARRFRVTDAAFAIPGTWHLELTVRTGLTEWLTRIPIRIGARPGP